MYEKETSHRARDCHQTFFSLYESASLLSPSRSLGSVLFSQFSFLSPRASMDREESRKRDERKRWPPSHAGCPPFGRATDGLGLFLLARLLFRICPHPLSLSLTPSLCFSFFLLNVALFLLTVIFSLSLNEALRIFGFWLSRRRILRSAPTTYSCCSFLSLSLCSFSLCLSL